VQNLALPKLSVIPNRAEGAVRNLLSSGRLAGTVLFVVQYRHFLCELFCCCVQRPSAGPAPL